ERLGLVVGGLGAVGLDELPGRVLDLPGAQEQQVAGLGSACLLTVADLGLGELDAGACEEVLRRGIGLLAVPLPASGLRDLLELVGHEIRDPLGAEAHLIGAEGGLEIATDRTLPGLRRDPVARHPSEDRTLGGARVVAVYVARRQRVQGVDVEDEAHGRVLSAGWSWCVRRMWARLVPGNRAVPDAERSRSRVPSAAGRQNDGDLRVCAGRGREGRSRGRSLRRAAG